MQGPNDPICNDQCQSAAVDIIQHDGHEGLEAPRKKFELGQYGMLGL